MTVSPGWIFVVMTAGLALGGCVGSEQVEERAGPEMSTQQSVTIPPTPTADCGRTGSWEPVAYDQLGVMLPELDELETEVRNSVVGTLNVVPASCCPCEGISNLAQCLVQSEPGCENLPLLAERAIRLAREGITGDALRFAIAYDDIWLDPNESVDDGGFPVEVWVDPFHPLMGSIWSKLVSIESTPELERGVRVRYWLPSDASDAAHEVVRGLRAAESQGQARRLLERFGQEVETESDPQIALSNAASALAGDSFVIGDWESTRNGARAGEAWEAEQARALQLGVRSAPTWFIDGYRLRGDQSLATLMHWVTLEIGDHDGGRPPGSGG